MDQQKDTFTLEEVDHLIEHNKDLDHQLAAAISALQRQNEIQRAMIEDLSAESHKRLERIKSLLFVMRDIPELVADVLVNGVSNPTHRDTLNDALQLALSQRLHAAIKEGAESCPPLN